MTHLNRLLIALLAVGLACAACPTRIRSYPSESPAAMLSTETTRKPEINTLLESIRKKHDLPALAAAVVLGGKTVAVGAVGYRKAGADARVTTSDRFHIGSCTKAMTATLIAILVERKQLRWDMTLAEAFPKLANVMHPEYRAVTLEQLLTHRGGFPNHSWPKGKSFRDMHNLPGTPRAQRRAYAEMLLREPPEAAPGSKFLYSNAGYAVAGVIAEEVTNTPWEELMRRHLFRPLGMKTAGFGAMGAPGKIDQPWQHVLESKNKRPIEPGPMSDNPPAIGPAGTVHCSLGDWAKFITAHVRGEEKGGLVQPETFKRLHRPPSGGDYALGWLVTERNWGGGRVLTHAGSNNQNFAVVWMAPQRDFAVLVATNQGGNAAAQACDETAAALIGQFLK